MRKSLSTEHNYRFRKTRNRFAMAFFSIMIPFFTVTLILLRCLMKLGIRIPFAMGPTIFTIVIAILCVLMGFWVSYYIMNKIFEPIEKLSEASMEVARGNYDIQIPYHGTEEEIKRAIDNFNFMAKELNSVEMMRDDFISNVSHEFKTPLTAIMGYVTLLQDPDLTGEEREEYIRMTFSNIEKLNSLTTDILQLSRLDNQRFQTGTETYRLDEQVREAILTQEAAWVEKEIELEIEMEEISYTGYRSLLYLVWTNLIGNAIKYSGREGHISIRLNRTPTRIRFCVKDDGIGMDQDTMNHIFEKFYQGDSSRQSQGNGLGLALCRKIIDLCGGYIFVNSQPGKGSSFTVELPAEEEKDTEL